MSAFGDHTPKQDILDWLEYVKAEHKLSWIEMVKLVIQVLGYITENFHLGD